MYLFLYHATMHLLIRPLARCALHLQVVCNYSTAHMAPSRLRLLDVLQQKGETNLSLIEIDGWILKISHDKTT